LWDWGAGVVVCLERGADLHIAQLMLLPLIVSCLSKIQIGFTFLVLAHPGSPGKGPMCVCVCSIYYISLMSHGYFVLIQYGDYDEVTYQPEMLATEDLLPQRVIDQYQMTPEMWADKIKLWYTDFHGMQR